MSRPRDLAEEVREICGDRQLKARTEKLVKLLVPVIKVLRLCDSGADACAVAFIYPAMFELKSFMDRPDADSSTRAFRKHLAELVADRWEFLHNPMHAAAYALNPRYHNIVADIMRNPEVAVGLKYVLERLSTSPEEFSAALSELVDYQFGLGEFGTEVAMAAAIDERIPPWKWWMSHGVRHPALTRIAVRTISSGSASSCCETNWSEVDCIQSKRRNRLKPLMVQDLVYVYHNMRVLKQMVQNEHAKTRGWLPIEYEPEVEPDTETELSSDDE